MKAASALALPRTRTWRQAMGAADGLPANVCSKMRRQRAHASSRAP